MKERLIQRLVELKTEFERGKKMLSEFDAKRAELRTTLLRLEGAITVITEELEQSQSLDGEKDASAAV